MPTLKGKALERLLDDSRAERLCRAIEWAIIVWIGIGTLFLAVDAAQYVRGL